MSLSGDERRFSARQRLSSPSEQVVGLKDSGRTRVDDWPQDLTACLRNHLSHGISEGILGSCADQGGFSPVDWSISSRRKLLLAYLCRRASMFLSEGEVQDLREALALASYSAWRRKGTASREAVSPGGSLSSGGRSPPKVSRQSMSEGTADVPGTARSEEMVLEVRSDYDVLDARTRALVLAKDHGASLFFRTRIATLVSELARRLSQQASGGTIELRLNHHGLVVVSRDEGPPIDGLSEILAHPERHRDGPGAAIAACKALARDIHVWSEAEGGTTITVKLALQ